MSSILDATTLRLLCIISMLLILNSIFKQSILRDPLHQQPEWTVDSSFLPSPFLFSDTHTASPPLSFLCCLASFLTFPAFFQLSIKNILLLRCLLTLKFSGSLINFAGPEGLLFSLTSWSQHSDLGLQPHLLSVSYMLVCFHSQSCRTFLNRHLMHHCWHHHLSTSRKTRIFFARASSVVQKHLTLTVIYKEILSIISRNTNISKN